MNSISNDIYRKGKGFVSRLLNFTSNNISDLNKRAAENTVNLMVLFSSNVPSKSQQKFTEAIAIKTKLTLQTVIDSFLGSDPEATVDSLHAMLRNSNGNIMSPLGNLASRLSESLEEQGIQGASIQFKKGLSETVIVPSHQTLGVILNEAPNTSGTNSAGNSNGSNNSSSRQRDNNIRTSATGQRYSVNRGSANYRVTVNDLTSRHDVNRITEINGTNGNSTESKYFSSQSHFVFDITGINRDGIELKTKFAFTVKINALTIESSELISGMGEINQRDTFFQYLKMRSGKASFFKDVLINIKALKTMAKRNSSNRLEDRIISELINGSNVLAPTFLRDLVEFKKFICVITLDDADILKSTHGLSITNGSHLYRMFDNMNMLTLVVADVQDESNIGVTLFDSDNPTLALSYRIKNGNDTESMIKKLFSGVIR